MRSFCADFAGLVRAVEFRDLEAGLSCVLGIGSDAWDRLFGTRARPTSPVPRVPGRIAPRDRNARAICCSISAPSGWTCASRSRRRSWRKLGDAVTAVDEVHGFRYFDDRDLLGFVDGTENPRGQAVIDAALIGAEDPAFAGGSYVITQKYLHDLAGWNALPTETQERIIGRTKLSDVELDDSVKPTSAHNALTTITENGQEFQIVRDNMPFGKVGERRIRHLFHRLLPHAAGDRADDREHVHRQAARQL